MEIQSQSYTDTGLVRDVNQDAVYEHIGDQFSIFCVADGMGGHQHGERASRTIVENLASWANALTAETPLPAFPSIMNRFEAMIDDVNTLIFRDLSQGGICGSTLVALLIVGDRFAAFSAGDSRIYRKRGFSFTQMIADDVWQNQSEISSRFTKNQMKQHLNYDRLTKAVGVADHLTLNRITGELKKGDIFFLCSDGVYKHVNERKLRKLITKQEALRDAVRKNGASDNFSMVTVWVK